MAKSDLELYKNIKARRVELGLTQTELARRAGYADKSMISRIEKGLIDLPQTKIMEIAQALHTTPSELMGPVSREGDELRDKIIARLKTADEKTLRRLLAYFELLQGEDF